MRKWGIVITLLYAAILVGVLSPGFAYLVTDRSWAGTRDFTQSLYSEWVFWILPAVFVAGEATLLFLSVDTSHKRLRPRTHLLVSCGVAGLFTALLAAGIFWSLGAGIGGEGFYVRFVEKAPPLFGVIAALWLLWAVVFYFYLRNSSAVVTRLTSWMLKGSVLELLIAVPSHVIARRRGDCSAPLATGFGIASGLAIMLLSFGPGVLLLYKKRLDAYSDRGSTKARGASAGSDQTL